MVIVYEKLNPTMNMNSNLPRPCHQFKPKRFNFSVSFDGRSTQILIRKPRVLALSIHSGT